MNGTYLCQGKVHKTVLSNKECKILRDINTIIYRYFITKV